MANSLGSKLKRCGKQAILFHKSRQTKNQNKATPKNNSGVDWAWDDERILAPVPPE